MNFKFPDLQSVSLILFPEFKTKTRDSISCVETRADFAGWTVNQEIVISELYYFHSLRM